MSNGQFILLMIIIGGGFYYIDNKLGKILELLECWMDNRNDLNE